jgi:uncharacterized protein
MVPMRDGKRMQADVYRPKVQSKKYPIMFVRTPYNFNYWDIQLGAPRARESSGNLLYPNPTGCHS